MNLVKIEVIERLSSDKSVIATMSPIIPSKYIDKLNNTIFIYSAEDTKDLTNISSTTIRQLLQRYYYHQQSLAPNTTSAISSSVFSQIETEETKTIDSYPQQTNNCSEIYEQLKIALHADVLQYILEHNLYMQHED